MKEALRPILALPVPAVLAGTGPSAESQMISQDIGRCVKAALQTLPRGYRRVIGESSGGVRVSVLSTRAACGLPTSSRALSEGATDARIRRHGAMLVLGVVLGTIGAGGSIPTVPSGIQDSGSFGIRDSG